VGAQPTMLTGDSSRPARPDLANLAKVAAARTRLQSATCADDALEGIREIVANLLGSEEMAIYRFDVEDCALWLHWSFGIELNRHMMMDVLQEPRLSAVVEGATFLRSCPDDENLLSITAPVNGLLPLTNEYGRTIGVIVVFGLLTQKEAFDETDLEVCRVVSTYGHKAVAEKPWHRV